MRQFSSSRPKGFDALSTSSRFSGCWALGRSGRNSPQPRQACSDAATQRREKGLQAGSTAAEGRDWGVKAHPGKSCSLFRGRDNDDGRKNLAIVWDDADCGDGAAKKLKERKKRRLWHGKAKCGISAPRSTA